MAGAALLVAAGGGVAFMMAPRPSPETSATLGRDGADVATQAPVPELPSASEVSAQPEVRASARPASSAVAATTRSASASPLPAPAKPPTPAPPPPPVDDDKLLLE
jgi:hypothetical protein